MSDKLDVYEAILRVQAALAAHGIQKMQKNNFDNYSFRGIEDVQNTLAPILAKQGLIVAPTTLTREETIVPTAKGGQQFRIVLAVRFDFISASDGSTHSCVHYGEAMDRSDKATNKAMTAAYKCAAFNTFCIPTEGSPDADSESPALPDLPILLTDQQVAAVHGLIAKCPAGTIDRMVNGYGVADVGQLPAERYDSIMTRLRDIAAGESARNKADGEVVSPT